MTDEVITHGSQRASYIDLALLNGCDLLNEIYMHYKLQR